MASGGPIQITGKAVSVFLGFVCVILALVPGIGLGTWMRIFLFVLGLVLLFFGVRNSN